MCASAISISLLSRQGRARTAAARADARLPGSCSSSSCVGLLTDPARFGGSADVAFTSSCRRSRFWLFIQAESADCPPTSRVLAHAHDRGLGYPFRRTGRRLGKRDHGRARREFPAAWPASISTRRRRRPSENEVTEDERAWHAPLPRTAPEFDYFNEQQHNPGPCPSRSTQSARHRGVDRREVQAVEHSGTTSNARSPGSLPHHV